MRKMLCEIDLEKAQGYPGRYLEHFSTMNRAPAYAECRESIAKPGLRSKYSIAYPFSGLITNRLPLLAGSPGFEADTRGNSGNRLFSFTQTSRRGRIRQMQFEGRFALYLDSGDVQESSRKNP